MMDRPSRCVLTLSKYVHPFITKWGNPCLRLVLPCPFPFVLASVWQQFVVWWPVTSIAVSSKIWKVRKSLIQAVFYLSPEIGKLWTTPSSKTMTVRHLICIKDISPQCSEPIKMFTWFMWQMRTLPARNLLQKKLERLSKTLILRETARLQVPLQMK